MTRIKINDIFRRIFSVVTGILVNVDQAEIHKFNEQANSWWDKHGNFKPLHDINPLRLSFIKKFISLSEKNIIDVGCGGGILSEAMALDNARVTGIDLANEALKVAKLHAESENVAVNYQLLSVEDMAASGQRFDVVTCMEMLEHVPDPVSIVKSCATLVKPGGYVFLSTINRNPKSYLFAIAGAEYILKLIPKGTHDYNKFIKPSELTQWARAANLIHQDSVGIEYNPFSKKYKLSSDISVNYLMCFQKG